MLAMMDTPGDKLSIVLGDDLAVFARIESTLPTGPEDADYPEDDDYGNLAAPGDVEGNDLGDDDRAARSIAAEYLARDGEEAFAALDALHDRLESAATRLDGDECERVERVRGVVLEALDFVEDAAEAWANGDNESMKMSDRPPRGWRRSDIAAAWKSAVSDEPDPPMMRRTAPPRVPRRTAPRPRGAGRPRGVSRSSSRSGDSGDDGSGEPGLPSAMPPAGLAVCPLCGNEAIVRPACPLCRGLGCVGRELRNRWKRGWRP